MKRKQLYLDDETERALKRVAAKTGRSEAFLVREALQQYLEEDHRDDDDPFEMIIGLVDDPNVPTDLAENHDHYLYGAPKKRP